MREKKEMLRELDLGNGIFLFLLLSCFRHKDEINDENDISPNIILLLFLSQTQSVYE